MLKTFVKEEGKRAGMRAAIMVKIIVDTTIKEFRFNKKLEKRDLDKLYKLSERLLMAGYERTFIPDEKKAQIHFIQASMAIVPEITKILGVEQALKYNYKLVDIAQLAQEIHFNQ